MIVLNFRIIKKFLKEGLFLILGSLIYAVAVQVFLSPLKISPGGLTGIAAALNYITHFPTGVYLIVFNIPIIILGALKFGKMFIFKSAVAVVLSSVFIDIVSRFNINQFSDVMLCAVFGGALIGLGLGLIMLVGASTGGIDIIVKTLNLKYNISIGRAFLLIDGAVILFAAIVYKDFQSALYSVVAVFVSSKVVDIILCGTLDSKAVFIITEREEILKQAITNEVDRGVTVLPAFGGYTGRRNNILLCVARNNEINLVRNLVKNLDSNAFFFILNAGDVIGKGFK